MGKFSHLAPMFPSEFMSMKITYYIFYLYECIVVRMNQLIE